MKNITGKVLTDKGLPIGNMLIRVLAPAIGSTTSLGEVYTDDQGNFSLSLDSDPELASIAVGQSATEPLLKSRLLTGADTRGRIDLVIASDKLPPENESEFAQIESRLQLLAPNMPVAQLKEDDDYSDIGLLAQQTGLHPGHLALFVLAHRQAAVSRAQVSAELFYGLMRQGYVASGDALLAMPNEKIKEQVEAAQQARVVRSGTWAPGTGNQITLDQMRRDTGNAFSTVDEFLKLIASNEAQRIDIANLYEQYANDKEAFWKNLPKSVDKAQLKLLEELSPMTLRNAPLTARLMGFSDATLRSAAELLKMSNYRLYEPQSWDLLLHDQQTFPPVIKGENRTAQRQNYANYLATYVNANFPMQVLAEKLKNGELPVKNRDVLDEIYEFLYNAADFDLATSAVGDARWDLSVAAVTELRRIQHFNQLAKDEKAWIALDKLGLDDPLKIARTPPRELAAVLDTSAAPALLAKAQEQTALNAMDIAVRARSDNRIPLKGLSHFLSDTSLDYCEVKDCESFHSAAAYLVDLLDFMGGDQTPGNAEARPFEVFSERRPDLLALELTCANTDTPMPYIDIVNEILEYKVANGNLGTDAVRNTPSDMAQKDKKNLLTQPRHIDEAAYEQLKNARAVYPLLLPFNYAWEASRTYLGKAKPGYYDFLAKTNNLQAQSMEWPEPLWLEYLGISPEEWQHVYQPLQIESTDLNAFFGGLTPAQRENVNTFLDLFQLRFDELEAVIQGAYFAKSPKPLALVLLRSGVDSCKAVNYKIAYRDGTPLSGLDWARLCFFLRLRQKLGWQTEHLGTWLFMLLSATSSTFGRAMNDLAWVKRVGDHFKISTDEGMELLLEMAVPGNAIRVLARLLNLPEEELSAYLSIIDPEGYERILSATSFPHVWYYSQCIHAIKSSGFTVEELTYLYAHRFTVDSPLVKSREAIKNLMANLNTGLLGVEGVEERASFIVDTLSVWFDLQSNLTRALISDSNPLLLHSVSSETRPMLADFDLRIADFSTISEQAVTDFQNAYVRLHKAALLCKRFKIFEDELLYLSGAAHNGFNGLLFEQTLSPDLNFENHWLRWYRYFSLRAGWTGGKRSLLPLISTTGSEPARMWLGIEETTWLEMKTFTGLSEADFDAERIPDDGLFSKLQHLYTLAELTKSHKISIQQIRDWSKLDRGLTLSGLEAIKTYFNQRFNSENAQQKATKEVEDQLRKRRRDALVAYLVQNEDGIENAGDLYTKLLIDVEMEPCMKTSRLKMALSSAQLFIQRSLLGLEELEFTQTLNGKRWKWMKNFRVWEANRKIFLYPENWLDPEFRHNQTELFKEAESQLMQGDMTDEQVKQVFSDYIHQFEQIAHLQPKALFTEKVDTGENGNRIVHVIGRTFSQPHRHYYRTWNEERDFWSAWTKIPIEIESEHLMPVIWQDSFFIFWLGFIEKGENGPVDSAGIPTIIKKVELSVSYTELRGGKWLPRKIVRLLNNYDFEPILEPTDLEFKKSAVISRIQAEDKSLYIFVRVEHKNPYNHTTYPTIRIKLPNRNQDASIQSNRGEMEDHLLYPFSGNFINNNEIVDLKIKAYNDRESDDTDAASVAYDSAGIKQYMYVGQKFLMFNTAEFAYFGKIQSNSLPTIAITPIEPGALEQWPNNFGDGFVDPAPWLSNHVLSGNFSRLSRTILVSNPETILHSNLKF